MAAPEYDPLRPNDYYYTPVQRVFYHTVKTHGYGGTFPAVRIPKAGHLVTTVNFTPFIDFLELQYPGKDTLRTSIGGKWGYVYNIAMKKLLLEARFKSDDPAQGITGVTLYRHYPTLPAHSTAHEQPTLGKDGWLPGHENFGLPLPPLSAARPADLLCFLSPWPLNAASLADMEANGHAKMRANFPPARINSSFFASNLEAVCIDPFAWALAAKQEYYEEELNAHFTQLGDEDLRHRRFIASVLQGVIDNGDKYGVGKKLDKKPRDELNDLDHAQKKAKDKFEASGAYLTATCLAGDDFIMVEKACMTAGVEGMEFLTIFWANLSVGINCCEPGRRFMEAVIQDTERYFHKQLLNENPPVPTSHYGTFRWFWYASCVNLSEVITAWRRMKALQGLPKLADYEKLVKVFGVHGVMIAHYDAHLNDLVNVITGGRKNVSADDFEKAWKTNKAFHSNTQYHLKLANAELLANGEHYIDVTEVNLAQSILGKKFGDAHAARALTGLKVIKVSGKFMLDGLNVLIAFDTLHQAKDNATTATILSAAGASVDFASLIFETAGVAKAADKALAGTPSVWGRTGWVAAKGGMAVLGIVSGLCDGYAQTQEVGKGWSRSDTARWVGGGIGLVGAGVTAFGGALALVSAIAPGLFTAAGLGGPFGIAVGAIGAGLLFLGALIVFAFADDNPWQEFASRSFLGNNRDKEPVILDWLPHDASMPCVVNGARRYAAESRILFSLMSNYVVGVDKEPDSAKFETGDPLTLFVELPIPDQTLRVFLTVTQEWWIPGKKNDNFGTNKTFVTAPALITRTSFVPGPLEGASLNLEGGRFTHDPETFALKRISLPLQPMTIRWTPEGRWENFAELRDSLRGRSDSGQSTGVRLLSMKASVRVVSTNGSARPYGNTFTLTILKQGIFNSKTRQAPTWELEMT